MDDFYDILGLVVAIGAILIIGCQLIIYYAEKQPIYDPMTDGPEDQRRIAIEHQMKISQLHCENQLRAMQCWELNNSLIKEIAEENEARIEEMKAEAEAIAAEHCEMTKRNRIKSPHPHFPPSSWAREIKMADDAEARALAETLRVSKLK